MAAATAGLGRRGHGAARRHAHRPRPGSTGPGDGLGQALRGPPLTTVDPAAPLGDLTPLRRAIGDAEIVGLGESTHGAAEEETLKHRTLRLLVERMGFRSVAWEEDWSTGLQIDRYIRTGKGA